MSAMVELTELGAASAAAFARRQRLTYKELIA